MKEKLYAFLPRDLADTVLESNAETALEIRLRAGEPARIRYPRGSKTLDVRVDKEMLLHILQRICGYSLYACAGDMARGFVTAGGWRVGIGGEVNFTGGESRGIKTVSSLNIRISRQINGCADKLMPYIMHGGAAEDTLIASPPICGKTTLLRDIARQVSDSGLNTAIIDERCEIAALDSGGIPCFDVGGNTDVISGCKKSVGALMALRSLAPHVMILDEIGTKDDMQAIYDAGKGGCSVICSVHCGNAEDMLKRRYLRPLIEDRLFGRIVFLCGTGEISAVLDRDGEDIWQKRQA